MPHDMPRASQPYSERCEIEDGQVVACELVKAGCGPAELLEPAEEAFDAVALPVELWRDHTFILDVTAGWNVGAASGSGNESNQRPAVVTFVSDKRLCRRQPFNQLRGDGLIGCLALGDKQTDGQTILIDKGMNLGA